jgi:uncharacterized low-complexity protein
MSRSNTTTLGMLGLALAGLTLSTSAFAVQPLAQPYMVAAAHVGDEGKCGEGKCGTNNAKPARQAAANKTAEGKCGEGQCGDARFAKTDTDDDGRVSHAEYLARVPTGQGWADKDANKDGYISEREAYDYVKGRFEANGRKVPLNLFAAFPE